MAIYRYQHGDRPLDGYTIQHALGRGGFGEVYFAISDSGREVALKSVQNYEDIELRGITHCMNLKHPQLVSIFDIKHNAQGLPFVIMEYVDGPSLRQILDAHPEGLGPAKSAFLFREMARGLTYLHDCGIVHRDLKPHNVFYEQGVVKIGDYSLSKSISTSHRSGHTVTVGTVHYMAPEISLGKYDHSVDIYALGVILYEMLTGQPPFLGQSLGEVLMKHVAGEVDLSRIDEPFARVIRKALHKDPEQRYASAQHMVDDLFGSDQLAQSVAILGPESLTMVADKAVHARAHGAASDLIRSNNPPPLPTMAYAHDTARATTDRADSHDHRKWGHDRGFGTTFGAGAADPTNASFHERIRPFTEGNWPEYRGPVRDSASLWRRITWCVALYIAMSVALAVVADGRQFGPGPRREALVAFTFVATWMGMIALVVIHKIVLPQFSKVTNKNFRAASAGTAALFFIPASLATDDNLFLPGVALTVSMVPMAWRLMASPLRPQRFNPELLWWPMLLGALVTIPVWWMGMLPAILVSVGWLCVFTQLIFPYDEEASRLHWLRYVSGQHVGKQPGGPTKGNGAEEVNPRPATPPVAPAHPVYAANYAARDVGPVAAVKPVAAKPVSPNFPGAPSPNSFESPFKNSVETDGPLHAVSSSFSRLVALVLTVPLFVGIPVAGLQRFYVGRIKTGLLWLFTFGLFGFGQIIDMIMLAVGQFRDAQGRRVLSFDMNSNRRSTYDQPVNQYSTVSYPKWTESRISYKIGNLFLNLIGGGLLAACLALGTVRAMGIPQGIALGMFGPQLQRELASEFRMDDWYLIVNHVLAFLIVVVGSIAFSCLLFARRGAPWSHLLRLPVAMFGFVFAVMMMGASVSFGDRWYQFSSLLAERRVGHAWQGLLEAEFWPSFVVASLTLVVSNFVLAWPARGNPKNVSGPQIHPQRAAAEPIESTPV